MLVQRDLLVSQLGPRKVDNPLLRKGREQFVADDTRVLVQNEIHAEDTQTNDLGYEKAGPRRHIFFEPAQTTAAIVTCGGLSPGLNNVIRSAYHELAHNYGVREVLGIREGYRGLNPKAGLEPFVISHMDVHDIHNQGGTMLGSSRGPQPPEIVVDYLESRGIDILFCVGGDGTQRGAHAIFEEVEKRGLAVAIVGIPKTIDNDIPHVWMSFGFATALERAAEVIGSAHVEALAAPNGVSIVKLMGRDAGFIAAGAAIVSQDVNFVLIPEVDFALDGEDGLLAALERRLEARGHAVVVVAEGAGQHLLDAESERRDASGNLLHRDIGPFLRERIGAHFDTRGIEINVKYMDPSYLIRSIPANAWDRILSDRMARNAVHAGMAGKTDVMIGSRHSSLVQVPIPTVVKEKARMELDSEFWTAVLDTTGQPRW